MLCANYLRAQEYQFHPPLIFKQQILSFQKTILFADFFKTNDHCAPIVTQKPSFNCCCEFFEPLPTFWPKFEWWHKAWSWMQIIAAANNSQRGKLHSNRFEVHSLIDVCHWPVLITEQNCSDRKVSIFPNRFEVITLAWTSHCSVISPRLNQP